MNQFLVGCFTLLFLHGPYHYAEPKLCAKVGEGRARRAAWGENELNKVARFADQRNKPRAALPLGTDHGAVRT